MNDDRQPDDENADPRDGGREIGKWLALAFIAALLAVSIYVVNAIIKQVNLQNCLLSGRRDCVEITPGGDLTPK